MSDRDATVEEPYINMVGNSSAFFQTVMDHDISGNITVEDGQATDIRKCIYKEPYYYDSYGEPADIGLDYMTYMDNTTQHTGNSMLLSNTNAHVITTNSTRLIQETRSTLDRYYKQFMHDVSERDTHGPYNAFIEQVDKVVPMITQDKQHMFIKVLCKVAAFLRYYGICIDNRVLMNILKCYGMGYGIEKVLSYIINGHCNLAMVTSPEGTKIVRYPKYSNPSKVMRYIRQRNTRKMDFMAPIIRKDFMLVIGRYFTTYRDYINITRVCSEYKDIIGMYKYNPIEDDVGFFSNKQTRCFYTSLDYEFTDYRYFFRIAIMFDVDYIDAINIEEECAPSQVTFNHAVRLNNQERYNNDALEEHKRSYKIVDDTLIINDRVTFIPESYFEGYYEHTFDHITFPSGVTAIERASFKGTTVCDLVIPAQIVAIKDFAFCDCDMLTSLSFQLPSHLSTIGDYAFNSTCIEDVTIPEGVTSIGRYCFGLCDSITRVTLPSSLKVVCDYAFKGTSIKRISIPDGVTALGERCFSVRLDEIDYVNIPKRLVNAGSAVFKSDTQGVTRIKDMYIPVTYDKINLMFVGDGVIERLHIRRDKYKSSFTHAYVKSTKVISPSALIETIVFYDYAMGDLIDNVDSMQVIDVDSIPDDNMDDDNDNDIDNEIDVDIDNDDNDETDDDRSL